LADGIGKKLTGAMIRASAPFRKEDGKTVFAAHPATGVKISVVSLPDERGRGVRTGLAWSVIPGAVMIALWYVFI